ncbi:Small heat shock protein C4 [Diplonema papillatum]|nr:Small heat shock protein C4 [Diplonema papillatum]
MFGFGGHNNDQHQNGEDPFSVLMRVFANEMPPMLLRSAFPEGGARFGSHTSSTGGFNAPVDVKDSESHYYLEADLPGVKQQDVKLTVDDSQLCLSASRQLEKGEYYMKERREGSFERCWTFPVRVVEDSVKASLKDGVLKVEMQKGQSMGKTINIS